MKTFLKVILVLALIVFIPVSPFLISSGIYAIVSKANCPELYIEGKYVSYPGGRDIEVFFKDFVSSDDYINIDYNYSFNSVIDWMSISSHTTAVLDLQYDNETYHNIKAQILPLTNNPDPNSDYANHGDFLMTCIMIDQSVYIDNYCGVYFDDKHNIIRYLFIHKLNRDEIIDYPTMIVTRNTFVNWNRGPNDLVFSE